MYRNKHQGMSVHSLFHLLRNILLLSIACLPLFPQSIIRRKSVQGVHMCMHVCLCECIWCVYVVYMCMCIHIVYMCAHIYSIYVSVCVYTYIVCVGCIYLYGVCAHIQCVCVYQFTHPCCWVEKRKPGERTGREWSGETGKISIKQRITGRKHILGKTWPALYISGEHRHRF